MQGANVHFEVEREHMGDRRVYIHLIVPTQFGVHHKEWNNTHDCCNLCGRAPLNAGKLGVFQLCLRVMGGTRGGGDGGKWEYAVSFDVYCIHCRSPRLQRYSLLMVRLADFCVIRDFIDEHAFRERCVEVENFLAGPKDVHDAVFNALVDSYLWRLGMLNGRTQHLCRVLTGKGCFYCHAEDGALVTCTRCNSLSFCEQPACIEKARKHHPALCGALASGRLFHTDISEGDAIYYIERNENGARRLYKPEPVQLEEKEEEDEESSG